MDHPINVGSLGHQKDTYKVPKSKRTMPIWRLSLNIYYWLMCSYKWWVGFLKNSKLHSCIARWLCHEGRDRPTGSGCLCIWSELDPFFVWKTQFLYKSKCKGRQNWIPTYWNPCLTPIKLYTMKIKRPLHFKIKLWTLKGVAITVSFGPRKAKCRTVEDHGPRTPQRKANEKSKAHEFKKFIKILKLLKIDMYVYSKWKINVDHLHEIWIRTISSMKGMPWGKIHAVTDFGRI